MSRYVCVFTPMTLNSAAAAHIMKTSCSVDVYRFLLKLGSGSARCSGKNAAQFMLHNVQLNSLEKLYNTRQPVHGLKGEKKKCSSNRGLKFHLFCRHLCVKRRTNVSSGQRSRVSHLLPSGLLLHFHDNDFTSCVKWL